MKSSAPRVSVIVPSYNHAGFLSARLESIARQTFRDFELILLDDMSSDGSIAILEQFARTHPCRLIRNEQNSGSAFKQWNKGIRIASGSYIWIAESDDFAGERFLEVMTGVLDRNPGCGLAYCAAQRVDGNGVSLGMALPTMRGVDLARWRRDYVNGGPDECARYLIRENYIVNASGVLFRRELYHTAGGVDETLRLSADWKFWAALLFHSGIAYVAEPLNFFRTHPGTVRASTRVWAQLREDYSVMQYIAANISMPRPLLEDLHTRAAVSFLHALLSERPSPIDLKLAFDAMEKLRFRLTSRSSAEIAKQICHAIGARLA